MSKILKFSRFNLNNFQSLKNCRLFCNSFPIRKFNSKIELSEISINKNEKNEEELDIKIPVDLQPYYSFGTLGHLPLFENPKILGKFTSFIPAPKLNITIFTVYTYFSYGTALFQPSLLLTLYTLNKILMGNFGKLTQILLLSLEKNCQKIYIRTLLREHRLEISDTKLTEIPINVGGTKYYELRNKKLNVTLYLSSEGTLLHNKLIHSILNGNISKVNMINE
jgi:hypothetical protein